MAETTMSFTDGEAYERFMGRWSRAVGETFLDWIAPPAHADWLDVGCGTGAFAELVLARCAPRSVIAVDPSPEQIAHARTLPAGAKADFRVADAQALPFPDGAFGVVASALVINFIPDRARGVSEMRRVARPGAIVAGYVWDFAGRHSPNTPLGLAARRRGIAVMQAPGAADSTLERMTALFNEAGLNDVQSRAIAVALSFPSFDDYWDSQTPSFSPLTHALNQVSDAERAAVKDATRESVPANADGSVSIAAIANAVKARA